MIITEGLVLGRGGLTVEVDGAMSGMLSPMRAPLRSPIRLKAPMPE
jgi:hypothetical protein